MYTFSPKRRAAAASAAGMMAVGALVAFGPVSSADAAVAAPTKYNCNVSGQVIPATVVGRIRLPARVKAGRSLAGIPTTMKVTLPDAQIHAIQQVFQFTWLSGRITNASLQLTKPGTVRALKLGALSIPQTTVPPVGQDMLLTASGKTARTARAPKAPGRYLVKMPRSLTFLPKSDSPADVPSLPCTIAGKAGNFGFMRVVR